MQKKERSEKTLDGGYKVNILITGGAGFVGSHLADALIEKGARVIIADNLSTGLIENVNRKARFYRMNICSDSVEDIFRREKIDIVSHQAAQMNVRRSVCDPVLYAQTNIIGSLNIIENCLKYKVKRIIFASSGGVIYSEVNHKPAKETDALCPVSPYGVSKLAVERYLEYYRKVHGLKYVAFRYGNVYGERQNPQGEAGVIAIFALKMMKGETPVIYGNGRQLRDYVYVSDVVKANLLGMEKGTGQIFNIGTGVPTSVNTLYGGLKNIIGFSGKPRHEPAVKGEIYRNCLDVSKARKILGWEPEVDFDKGLLRTAKWMLDYYGQPR